MCYEGILHLFVLHKSLQSPFHFLLTQSNAEKAYAINSVQSDTLMYLVLALKAKSRLLLDLLVKQVFKIA